MNTPKNQHYVPRFILKRFSFGKGKHIYAYDKRFEHVFTCSVNNAAVKNKFYDIKIDEEEITIEHALSEIETKAAIIYKKILDSENLRTITDLEKKSFSDFLAIQFLRTPNFREMYKDANVKLRDKFRKMGVDPEETLGAAEQIEEESILFSLDFVMKHHEYAPYFSNKDWVLMKTTKPQPFYISDNPISLQNIIPGDGLFGNIGLAVEGIEIYMPLSPTLTLALFCKSHRDKIMKANERAELLCRLNPELAPLIRSKFGIIKNMLGTLYNSSTITCTKSNVTNLNYLQVRHAERFIYSNTNDFDLIIDMLRNDKRYKTGPRTGLH